ncbi:hypothetical protein AVEN_66985-1 [Araneus ventricosus]|uniref:Uncharacterized protein n=1 Tax=Araneus ventricosus TaxID=182803 RepID=A0A4Y2LB02_ARAVE|nr:hypothetical protein AVEN_66985-1 [Araneus ventricosus]
MKTLHEYMVDFMSVVARQQAVTCMILGKCHEHTDFIEDKLEKLQTTNKESIQLNYAAATKIRPRSRRRKRDEGKLVLLYPKEEVYKSTLRRREEIRRREEY